MSLDKHFQENVNQTKNDDTYLFSCKKGMWSVCSPDEARARSEAKYYFTQYWLDGEYDDTAHHKLYETIRGGIT